MFIVSGEATLSAEIIETLRKIGAPTRTLVEKPTSLGAR